MKLNIHAFGIAGASLMAMVHLVYALLLLTASEESFEFLANLHMFHMPRTLTPYIYVTPTTFAMSLIFHIVLGYLFFAFFAAVYNYFVPENIR